MSLFTKLLLCFTIILFFGWQSLYAQNMSNGSSTTCSTAFFDSGGSGGNYGSSETLVYTFTPAIAGNKIRVTFSAFNLENTYDFLDVFNGNSTAAIDLIGSYTGGTAPTAITSTAADGRLTFRFRSDPSVTSTGWEAAISCVAAPPTVTMSTTTTTTCSATFFDSGGSGGNYTNGQNLVHTFTPATAGQKIRVSFTSFAVENQATCNRDRLIIYDGPTTAATVLGTYCGTALPPNFISSHASGSLTFQFISNANTVAAGWRANISCVPPPPIIMPTGVPTSVTTCGATLVDSGGSTGNYINNGDGTLTIFPATAGTKVRLTFISFATEACCDRLEVFNGNSTAAVNLIGTFAGTTLPSVITSSAANGALTLRFDADGSVNNTGFDISISCFDPCPIAAGTATISATSICGGENVTLNLTGQSGTVQWQQSTNGGVSFTNIIGATNATQVVNPTVTTIYRAVVSEASCVPTSATSNTVSVTINPCIIMPTGTPVTVATCGSTLYDSGGSAGNYTNNGDGTLTILPSTTGAKVTLTFTEFNTESCCDRLEIFNGNSTAAVNLLGTFAGTASPGVITSTAADGSLTLRFDADGSVNNTGWAATVSCECGFAITNLTVNNCAGSSPTIYDLNIGFNAVFPSSANYQIYINGALQTTQPYTTNPQNVTIVGLVNNNSPVEIEIRDALDATCSLTRTLFSAAQDRQVCGTEAKLNAQTTTGGQWTVISGPNTPTFSNNLNPNATLTGLVTGTYTLRWTSTVSAGCSFTDEIVLTVNDNCTFDTSDPDVSNICAGTLTSHDTYPANYPANYDQVVTLCPEADEALQLTFNTINLGTGDNIQIWLSDTQAGAADLTFTNTDNGRSFTIKSQDPSGCITVRFTSNNNASVGQGFTSTISCTTPDDPASVDCIGAVPLCTDLTYAFPTGGAGGSGTQNGGINNGCAAFTNVKWFYLEMAETGNFEFDINPIVPTDDYDFAIWGPFTSYGDVPCASGNNAGMGAPIRCNYSGTTGITGLGASGTNPSEGAGGNVYSTPLPVTVGQFYVMMVDDYSNNGNGFNVTANTIGGNNPTNCDIVDCDAFFGNQVFSSSGATNYGNNYICYDDAITLGAVDNSFTTGGLAGEQFYFVHSDNPNTPFVIRNNFIADNLATSDYVTSNLGGLANNQLTFTNNGSAFADNQIWNIYATTGVAGVPDPSFVNSCSFWTPFEVKLLPEITATLPTGCDGDFSITNINGGLPRFQQDREGGATTTYTVDLVNALNAVAYTQNVVLGNNADFTGVATGTYTVRITDQNGCPVSLGTISISNAVYDNFCSAAPAFLGNNGPFTNECATLEVGETGGSCFTGATNQVSQSIWTAFTPTLTTTYLLRIAQGTDATFPATGGFFDSEIAIYTNSATCPALPVLTQLACSDNNTNAALPSALYSEVPTIAMTAGVTYYIQIDGKAFFTGATYNGSSQADDIILYIEEFDLLPIELKLFDGIVKDEGNLIFWETSMEKDVEYFSLEASVDGITFFEVNRQDPNQRPSNYEFLHTEPQQKMYYRLKDVSTTGKESYSNVIYLVRENAISIEKGILSIYPNPTLDNVTIRMFYPNSKEVSLQLYDTKGVELINKMIEIPSSQVIEKTLSLTDLPAGVYILTLTTEMGREVVKVVKQ